MTDVRKPRVGDKVVVLHRRAWHKREVFSVEAKEFRVDGFNKTFLYAEVDVTWYWPRVKGAP